MSHSEDSSSNPGRFEKTWAHLIEDQAHLDSDFDPLLAFVFTEVPEGHREVPDFRLPRSLRKKWQNEKRYRELRKLLHRYRVDNDDEYRLWWQTKAARKHVRRSKEGWVGAAQRAERLRAEMEKDPNTKQQTLLILEGVISTLWDERAKPSDRNKAIQTFVQLEGLIEPKEAEGEEKRQKIASMTIPDLIRTAMEGPDSDSDDHEG